jgi:hypothetical protein
MGSYQLLEGEVVEVGDEKIQVVTGIADLGL